MTTRKEMSRLNDLVRIIEEAGKIDKVDLVIRARIGISYFDKLKPFLEKIYVHKVRYDVETRMWYSLKTEKPEIS